MTEHMGWRFLPQMMHAQRSGQAIDWLGVLLMTLAIGTLLMTTELGERLGFQLPNLTLQMQSAVGQADQGAASALIQTLRTLGSMFGASLAGLLVNLGFSRAVARSLAQEGIQDAGIGPSLALVRRGERRMLLFI